MENWKIWAGIGVAAVLLFVIATYNNIVGLSQRRKNAFHDIDAQLKLRADLIPNLVETVKGYATHEKEVLEQVTAARATAMSGGASASIPERMAAESALSGAMMKLMAVAENYPQLKADANFRQLQGDLSDVENKLAAARRFFNNATSEYNTAIKSFPAVLFAGLFGFREEAFFELDDAERAATKTAPQVKF